MRITSVELHPAGSSAVCVLSFRDPGRQNPYSVKAIVGLDADEIVSRYYGGSGSTAKYNLSLVKREPVIRISLNPRAAQGETYSSLRDELYKMIASSRTGLLELQFKDGSTVVAAISGFVTKLEAPHFEKEPEVQLTIDCEDGLLRAPTDTIVSLVGLDPASTTILDNASTAPHGLKLEIGIIGPVNDILIKNPDDPTWQFNAPGVALNAGDVLQISSEEGAKYFQFLRDGYTWGLANKIVAGSVWPIMFPGATKLGLTPSVNLHWNSISYRRTYWGV